MAATFMHHTPLYVTAKETMTPLYVKILLFQLSSQEEHHFFLSFIGFNFSAYILLSPSISKTPAVGTNTAAELFTHQLSSRHIITKNVQEKLNYRLYILDLCSGAVRVERPFH